MTTRFFTSAGQFYRGNLHTHSTRSDGVLEPEEVCRRYQAEGYDFIALTDHFLGNYDYPITDTTAFQSPEFTTLLGAELHIDSMDNGDIWHVLAVGLPRDFTPPDVPHFRHIDSAETVTELTNRAAEAGAFISIVHPHWSGLTEADARRIPAAHAVEVYNHGCAIENDRGDGLLSLDHMLNEGRKLNLIATDDAHFGTPDHFGGWVMVKAQENTPEALLTALKDGDFYATTGPKIHDIRLTRLTVEIDCSSAATITVLGNKTAASTVCGDNMTTASIPLDRFAVSPWIRITVIDHDGKRAWSNPIWLDH
ncbi:phosphotransferase [Marinosulfonomonas sp. PRT-SC04]|nr:phosphotransferase [Marinosulfonomonas sp. PRT-SC04]